MYCGNNPQLLIQTGLQHVLNTFQCNVRDLISIIFFITFGVFLNSYFCGLDKKGFEKKRHIRYCTILVHMVYRSPSEEGEISRQRESCSNWLQGGRLQRRQPRQQSVAEGRRWRRHGSQPLQNLLARTSASHLKVLLLRQMIVLARFSYLETGADLSWVNLLDVSCPVDYNSPYFRG